MTSRDRSEALGSLLAPRDRGAGSSRVGGGLMGVLSAGLVLGAALSGCEAEMPEQDGRPVGGTGGGGEVPPPLGGQGGASLPEEPSDQLLGERGSELGAGCSVRNDCAEGFSCIRGVCQPARFQIEPTGKECFVTDCQKDADCCDGLVANVPEQCKLRPAKCFADLPGCQVQECNRSSDCSGGGTCRGRCAVTAGACGASADCLKNRCVDGACILDFASCSSDAECLVNACAGGTCDCSNPSHEPAHPVCEDESCEDSCPYACESSRCVLPTACSDSEECFGALSLCDDGKCVECSSSSDCSFDKACISGRCETPCRDDANCPLFEACQAGECIYVGCRSDRECRLLPALESAGVPAGTDPRLLRCHTEDGIGRCIVPCQTDAQCPFTEVCSGGVCQYIGCELDGECKSIVGLHDQKTSEDSPWVSTIECREPENEGSE